MRFRENPQKITTETEAIIRSFIEVASLEILEKESSSGSIRGDLRNLSKMEVAHELEKEALESGVLEHGNLTMVPTPGALHHVSTLFIYDFFY